MRAFRDIRAILTILCGISLVLSVLNPHPALAYVAILFGSYFAVQSAWSSVKQRELDVNLLMVLAAIGAITVDFVGAPGHVRGTGARDAAALLFLFSLSGTLEALAMAKTRSAIEGLIKLRPTQALVVDQGIERKIPVEQLQLDDLVRIPPFEPVPVDGEVVEGRSSVDQSAMTGESTPVPKAASDYLLAGTNNLEGSLLMRVRSIVGASTLDKIVDLVREAQENKASGERISTWFGQRYTFFVVGAFLLSLLVRLLIGEANGIALYTSLTLLVALSPCALVISTPATTLSALAWAGRRGILVRGGQFIEASGQADILALDKTGTLTTGKPTLVEICVCAGAAVAAGGARTPCTDDEACWHGRGSMSGDAANLLRAAAAAEEYSSHPVAESIRKAAIAGGLEPPQAKDHTAEPGLGVRATVEGKEVLVGQRRYLEAQGIRLPQDFHEHVEGLERKGLTVAVMAFGERLAAFGFADTPRRGAHELLANTRKLGFKRVVMLTGDTFQTASWVAKELGIEDFRAGLLPDEKTLAIDDLAREGSVMMVGDGINDAPCLARASVGVAMGGLGSDIAMNAADVVLMHDRLDRLPELVRLGRRTNRIIRANLAFAASVIVILTAVSLFAHLPLPLAVLGHEGSTVLVILNGLRLLRGA
ncbi:MAG: Zn2+/Cd2+-exporting ATPase [Fimbriimonadaceae bacterium]|jgi:Cd2+/Zn2+-exporting ATPase|nr:Zn2+/Cd2+-exporting ATPase [Fimbriimonadaceae bacterium]